MSGIDNGIDLWNRIDLWGRLTRRINAPRGRINGVGQETPEVELWMSFYQDI